MIFECPPALHTWSLSNIPFQPGVFPSEALFTNFDHLLWRANVLGVPEEALLRFPWIIWYIWKARNEKVFNDKEIHPLDTLQLAMAEADTWQWHKLSRQA